MSAEKQSPSGKITAFFVGGVADGMTKVFDARPPDRVQATREGEIDYAQPFEPPMLYSRSDLSGGVVMYVPCGSLLHDAFTHVLRHYADTRQASREAKGG